jgi:hypothetical protein
MGYWEGWYRAFLTLMSILLVNVLIVLFLFLGDFYTPKNRPESEFEPASCSEIKDVVNPVLYRLMCNRE